MKFNKGTIIGIVAGSMAIVASIIVYALQNEKSLNIIYFLAGSGFLIIVMPFVIDSIVQTKVEREKDAMFLEFSRALVENVEAGTPISKGIINLKSKNFGSLSPHIEKLANQIEIGIPVKDALETFAYDTKSKTIIREVTLIREAEKTGGNINTILESVASSVSEIEKLRAERRAAISAIVTEGYIIFVIFIIIMLVMEIKIIPMTANIGQISAGAGSFDFGTGAAASNVVKPVDSSQYSTAFLSLLISQGFFAGLVIGKLSEGNIKAGAKHSFILVALAILISTGAKILI